MSNIRNRVTLCGNLGKDVEIKQFESGNTIAKFSLATTEKYKNKSGELVTDTQWHNIVAWGKTAEFAQKWLKKGSTVSIEGKLTYRKYDDKDGNKRYLTEVVMTSFVPHSYEKSESQPAPPSPKPEPAATEGADDFQDLPF